MTLKFNKIIEVVEIHVHAKFHQAKYNGSLVRVYKLFCPISQRWKILWPWPL